MVTIRRWYIFLVCAVSLQTVTWSVIQLIKNLIRLKSLEVLSLAFPLAVILIGFPLYIVHWLWAQRLAKGDMDERGSGMRRLYLFGMLAGFLAPFIGIAFDLVEIILELIFRIDVSSQIPRTDLVINDIVPLLILPILWAYHWRIITVDASVAPETGITVTLRRLYIYGFSATGLVLVSLGVNRLLEWILFKIWNPAGFITFDLSGLASEIARILIGLPLWLIFWQWAQRRFAQANEEERNSVLRKIYLYVTVFVSVLSVVIAGTSILAGILRSVLGLDPKGDVRQPLSIIIGMAVWWAYHASIIRNDARQVQDAPRQAGIRRLYFYLVAVVGLGAFLVGLGGDISVLVRSLAGDFNENLKGLLTWFTAAFAAGLPVWLLPWRQLQSRAVALTPAGAEERKSIVRKIYLFLYLFIATMTVLSGGVYIATQLFILFLDRHSLGNTTYSDLGQAVAFTIIGVGVWLYHGHALRMDGAINRREQSSHLESHRIVVLDMGEDQLGQDVLDGLRWEMPGLTMELIQLPFLKSDESSIQEKLAGADMIIGSWTIFITGRLPPAVTNAVVSSPARKLIIPTRSERWEWAGVDRWNSQALVRQTVLSIRQMIDGEEVKAVRPMSIGSIVGISIGVLFLILAGGSILIQWLIGGF